MRLELQADCFAGVWAHHAQQDAADPRAGRRRGGAATPPAAIGDDTLQRQSQGTVVPDSFTHGSGAARALVQGYWLSHVNANLLKVKLATAIIGISSIHLLKTFINAENLTDKVMMWQTMIHITFVLSAVAIAYIDKLMTHNDAKH